MNTIAPGRGLPPWLRWIFRAASAVILLQTLFFKFTAAPESVAIFTKVGAEPVGRIASGVVELLAALLLLWPRLSRLGALTAFVVMSGALVSHLTVLGLVVQGDGGLLFGLATAVWFMTALLLWDERRRACAR